MKDGEVRDAARVADRLPSFAQAGEEVKVDAGARVSRAVLSGDEAARGVRAGERGARAETVFPYVSR